MCGSYYTLDAYGRTRAGLKFDSKIALALFLNTLARFVGFPGSASRWHCLRDKSAR